jgi:metal-dependent hydrolase (beta-lactamase superfamily II)
MKIIPLHCTGKEATHAIKKNWVTGAIYMETGDTIKL